MIQLKNSESSQFAFKLRDKATIRIEDGSLIKRNVYSHYVSNNNPVYIRYDNRICYVDCVNYRGKDELFMITLRGKKL